jgi:YidC/Oxa1 family membrane protein insertase
MKPKIAQINDTLKGAEKSEQILQTYKEFGISPFSGLKGSIGLFVQLPILIALFAVTTESALFREAPFLWITDLSLPDRTLEWPLTIPILGSYLNLLPILLGVICTIAALVQAHSAGTGTSPRSGLILALAFVIFFYPCAAALVLYWMVVNVSQIFEGLYVTRVTPILAHQ